MLLGDDVATLTDDVSGVAVNFNLVRRNLPHRIIAIRITVGHNRVDELGSSQIILQEDSSIVHDLRALAVPTDAEFGLRALRLRLLYKLQYSSVSECTTCL